MEEGAAPEGIKQTLGLLQRMIAGERLRVRDGVTPGGPQWAAVQRRLRCLAETVLNVRRDEGPPETFAWVWPSSEQSSPAVVWSLAAARTMLHGFNESVIGDTLKGLLESHRARLPRDEQGVAPDPGRMFFASTRLVQPLGLDPGVIDRVARAIFECRVIRASYVQFEGPRIWVLLQPWSVLFSDSGVYVYGLCTDCEKDHHVQTRRLYNLARMTDIRTLDERFAYPLPEEYDPRVAFQYSFGVFLPAGGATEPAEVVLRFAPEWKSYLERHQLHRSQSEPIFLHDGRTMVTMRLYVTYDLVRWVRGLGCEVEILSPALLRDWVASGEGGNYYKTYEATKLR